MPEQIYKYWLFYIHNLRVRFIVRGVGIYVYSYLLVWELYSLNVYYTIENYISDTRERIVLRHSLRELIPKRETPLTWLDLYIYSPRRFQTYCCTAWDCMHDSLKIVRYSPLVSHWKIGSRNTFKPFRLSLFSAFLAYFICFKKARNTVARK